MVNATPQRPRPTQVGLAVSFAGLSFKNPVTVASGTFGSGEEYAAFVDVGSLGAVTTKGVSLKGWDGNGGVRIAGTPSGMLNSIGLQNKGVAALMSHDLPWLKSQGATVIVNVSGHSAQEYVQVVEALEASPCVDAYELNVSCPNVDAGGMAFGCTCAGVDEVVSLCRAVTRRPLIAKLTPNVTSVADIACAAEAAGADAVSLINTVLGMAIDARTRRPVFNRVVAGLSGPAVKPIALRAVYEVNQACTLPIIGMGGVSTGLDAVEFMLAGASMVAVGTANFTNPCATIQVINGIIDYCEQNGVSEVSELIGGLR